MSKSSMALIANLNWLTIARRQTVVPILCRSLSNNLWNKDLDLEIRKEIEDYWKKQFTYDNLFDKSTLKDKFYVLSMFPYPSGNLHMGHVRVYTISDSLARFHRMNGRNVFQPMGWDAFGLPAENAAFERDVAPEHWTIRNIEQMKSQLKNLSCTFDWNHELSTCDPKYYRWTQYIFLKMYEAGLVYQREALVNWDPVDETVLADEQVDEDGRSWRSGAKVEKRVLKQWFIKTTKFAKDLRDGLNDPSLINWKDIIDVQKNWIDECNGYSFDLRVKDSTDKLSSINVWVADPLSMLSAEFIVVKPNSMIDVLSEKSEGLGQQLQSSVINPFTNTTLPIFVSDEVEYPFGRDIYVGVPSKVPIDREFAKKRGLKSIDPHPEQILYNRETICKKAQEMKIGGYPVSSKLNDWLISRQRYWGTPIPIVHCKKCGAQPVPYDQLPIKLPTIPENYSVGKGLHALLRESDWKNTTCPNCGSKAVKESDTMDTFVDSSWYYLRYPESDNEVEPFSKSTANELMPVDIYVGGKEHAVLHLYYARFVSYFLHSIGLIKHREPFKQLLCQGMVKGQTYKTSEGKYLKPDDVEIQDKKAICKSTGEQLTMSWEKMSKSKCNGVEPSEVLEKYGVDTTRLFLLFSVAPMSHRNWSSDLFPDVITWQHRLWLTIKEFLKFREMSLESQLPGFNMEAEEEKLIIARNRCVRFVTYNYSHTQQLAAAISSLQGFTNSLRVAKREVRKFSKEYERSLATFIIMLTPMAPHFAATLWHGFTSAPGRLLIDSDEINWNENVIKQKWPKLDKNQSLPFIVRINDMKQKFTSKLQYHTFENLTTEDALSYALLHPKVKKYVYKKDIFDLRLEKIDGYSATLHIKVDNERFYEDGDSY